MKGNLKVVTGMFLLAGLFAGCESTEMNKRNQHRVENMQGTMDILASNEADRAERLGQTVDELEKKHQLDLARTAENSQKLKNWVQEDFDNWEQQWPLIRKQIKTELAGHPENLEPTLIEVLD